QGRGAPCGESFWHWALGADGGHGHAQPPFRSSRLIGAERQPTSDCRQSLQQSPGVDTTVYGISAVLYHLAANPDQYERLREEPRLKRRGLDEALRVEAQVQMFFCYAIEPIHE